MKIDFRYFIIAILLYLGLSSISVFFKWQSTPDNCEESFAIYTCRDYKRMAVFSEIIANAFFEFGIILATLITIIDILWKKEKNQKKRK